ncbi:MAG: hypothetical protein AAB375_00900 [Patescibacteria group bacterium]
MNQFEQSRERIPTREEVLDLIRRRAEGCTVLDERRDERGVYYLEAKSPETRPGEYTVYVYLRKGTYPGGSSSLTTRLMAEEYTHGDVDSGDDIAELDPATNEWVNK